ncbi:hypothetical protein CLV48_1044 [Cecembia rubra]|jgi:hypothetical protein|uniref:Uncharacterized protein n=1 Tax=Cecembia rubra TaxID=1485585 RepID=A0A2P8E5U3_9BACT|nr:hypothetical protein CLV48_1044 [Cecembia rubra]
MLKEKLQKLAELSSNVNSQIEIISDESAEKLLGGCNNLQSCKTFTGSCPNLDSCKRFNEQT